MRQAAATATAAARTRYSMLLPFWRAPMISSTESSSSSFFFFGGIAVVST